jgi:hypothetical protein
VPATYRGQVLRAVLGPYCFKEKWRRTPYLHFGYWRKCSDCEEYIALLSRLVHL